MTMATAFLSGWREEKATPGLLLLGCGPWHLLLKWPANHGRLFDRPPTCYNYTEYPCRISSTPSAPRRETNHHVVAEGLRAQRDVSISAETPHYLINRHRTRKQEGDPKENKKKRFHGQIKCRPKKLRILDRTSKEPRAAFFLKPPKEAPPSYWHVLYNLARRQQPPPPHRMAMQLQISKPTGRADQPHNTILLLHCD